MHEITKHKLGVVRARVTLAGVLHVTKATRTIFKDSK